jgi:hypothetical protein
MLFVAGWPAREVKMKIPLQLCSVFVAVSALFSLSGGIQSAYANDMKGFRGYVCDYSGKPVPNAKVTANGHRLETDSQGRFLLPHDQLKGVDTVFVTVEPTFFENTEGISPYRWEVNFGGLFAYVTGEEYVTIRPRPPGAVSGRVLSVDGKPIAGAKVSAYINVGNLVCSGLQRVGEPVQTDSQGRFFIPKLYASHDYRLRVEVTGYERKWGDWVHVRCVTRIPQWAGGADDLDTPGLIRPPGAPEMVEIRLRDAPAVVAGKVVDPEGKPVPKARVLLGHHGDDGYTETDTNGNFQIDSLLPDQEVQLWAPPGPTVKAKAGTTDLRLVIERRP